ncbi:MAG: hypothetical protein JNL21_27720 [Myxococcales bacterium]|nr:hypothetical protein [Myxococcales bacterium]
MQTDTASRETSSTGIERPSDVAPPPSPPPPLGNAELRVRTGVRAGLKQGNDAVVRK